MPDMTWEAFELDAMASAPQRGPKCRVGLFLEGLPAEGRQAVEKALANRSLTVPGIRSALADRVEGIVPSIWSMQNHRRGQCRCGS